MAYTISLKKGENISLSKGLSKIRVGLGWDPNSSLSKHDYDLDAVAMLLNGKEKLATHEDFIFFNNLKSKCGSVMHQGDNLTGEGEGDDEKIDVELSKVPADVTKILLIVVIYQAGERKQHFGQINNSFIRIVDLNNKNAEITRYDLKENFEGYTAIVFGELYKHNGEWKFRAVGKGLKGLGVGDLREQYLKV